MEHPFSDTELLEVFEIAHYALADGDVFNTVADKVFRVDDFFRLDLDYDYLLQLRDKLDKFMTEGR